MAQKLAKCGLGVGISSGANFIGALMLQNKLGKDSIIVTVFPDDNKKYLSTDLMREEKVKEAEALRMIAYREDEVVYKTVEEAKKATEKQLADLQNDIQLVAKTKKIVEKLRFDLTNAGVTIEPQTEFWKNSGKSKAEFNSEVKDFIKYTNSALKAQREAKQAFEQVIADYRAKGLDITVDGIEGYRYSAVEDEVLDIKIKLDKISGTSSRFSC